MRGKFLQVETPENAEKQLASSIYFLRTMINEGDTIYCKLVYRNTGQDCNDDSIGVRGYAFFCSYTEKKLDIDNPENDRTIAKTAHITYDTCIVTGYRWYNGPDSHPYIIDSTYLVTNQAVKLVVMELSKKLFGSPDKLKMEYWR